jgi:ABC-type phosphate transport system substrate-binding protein
VLVLSLALIGAILEGSPDAIQGAGFRKALAWMRGDGLTDPLDVATKWKKRVASQKTESQVQVQDQESVDGPTAQP